MRGRPPITVAQVIDTPQLMDTLDSVITIPVIPFRNGEIDYAAHRKNIEYLLTNNSLSDDRPRVVCIAGTSLIQHVSYADQNRLITETGEVMGDSGILLSALVPNPIASAGDLVRTQSEMSRPPDGFLIMPLGGVYSTAGLYAGLRSFGEEHRESCGARFIYYLRQSRDQDEVIRLIQDSDAFIGVKVGTTEDDVPAMVKGVGDSGIVIWGVGDRSTKAAQLETRGHTSGISVLLAKAGDAINNAQRAGDFDTAVEIERRITPLEEIRFENGRVFNYSAVVEAMILSGFNDIDPGEGGPFNPRVSSEVAERVKKAIEGVLDLH